MSEERAMTQPLSAGQLERMDACSRAADYLAVGQIYLKACALHSAA